MLRNTHIFIVLFAAMSLSATPLRAQSAAEADDLYRAGDYSEAIDAYEGVLATGQCSPELYYNLGNAYYRTDQMGPAILNYSRALRLRPGMSDARENLALAESHTVDRVTPLPRLFVVRWVDALTTRVPLAVWRWAVVLLLAAVGGGVVMLRLGRNRGVRKGGLIVTVVAALLWLAALLLMLRATSRWNARSEAVVMSQAVSVKGSPEDGSVDKLMLHEGTVVNIADSLSGWYKVVIADGSAGWCRSMHVERI